MPAPSPSRFVVVIPTYNEVDNIAEVTALTMQVAPHLDILFVDDNSTDGTQARIAAAQESYPGRIHVIHRSGKLGLGTAYIAGFKWALARDYAGMVEMDADLSHNPKDLRTMTELLATHDVVIGSRYVQGGRTENWGLVRRLISRSGSLYSRLVLGFGVKDMTAGFVAWRRNVIAQIGLDRVQSQGYGFQVELKFRAHRAGYSIFETPIVFKDRVRGTSKMGAHIITEAIKRVFLLRLAAMRDPNF